MESSRARSVFDMASECMNFQLKLKTEMISEMGSGSFGQLIKELLEVKSFVHRSYIYTREIRHAGKFVILFVNHVPEMALLIQFKDVNVLLFVEPVAKVH